MYLLPANQCRYSFSLAHVYGDTRHVSKLNIPLWNAKITVAHAVSPRAQRLAQNIDNLRSSELT